MTAGLSSSHGLLALLLETDPTLLHFALQRLATVVDDFWYEVADSLQIIEELSESNDLPLPTRQAAALLASRTYFHLNACDDSVQFALAAGPLFADTVVQQRSDFSDTILRRCIDMYVTHREKTFTEGDRAQAKLDPRLGAMFESVAVNWVSSSAADVAASCLSAKDLVGFCLRSHRVDLLKTVLSSTVKREKSGEVLSFTLQVANSFVTDIVFRAAVQRCLADVFRQAGSGIADVDPFDLVECLLFLEDAKEVAGVVRGLMETSKATALQVAFDLVDRANQDFLKAVLGHLGDDVDGGLRSVLTGEVTTQLYLKFLYSQCKADIHVLSLIKRAIPSRVSVLHNGTVMASALMYSGTTQDSFLRDNLNWLGRAQGWAKFAATASVGVVHKGHTTEAMSILAPYLPEGTVGKLPFQEAGALYALGLVFSGSGGGTSEHVAAVQYLKDALSKYAANEQMVHGATLGLGLVSMASHDQATADLLIAAVGGADAVSGESAALATGLVMLGSGNAQTVATLASAARDVDQKEKTIRGLVMGIALVMLGKEAIADDTIDVLTADRDAWVRVGGCFTIGLAYAGTGSAAAVEKLLQVCVKDVNNEVRRAAVMMIGFVCLKNPSRAAALLRTFADSYNAHIRYGVAIALGVAAAGGAHSAAVDLLWELKEDAVDFVRQGAFIALAMVMPQQTATQNPRAKELRQMLAAKSADNKCDVCTRFGCILASGILDAGGRNCTFALHQHGHAKTSAVVGAFLFSQYWFWFPYSFMLSLAMQPTCVIGLTENLTMPKYALRSDAPPADFAAPPPVLQERKEAKAAAGKAAVLSVTQKQEARRKKRHGRSSLTSPTEATAAAASISADAKGENKADEKKEEPKEELLHNPARVVGPQVQFIQHNADERYKPLRNRPGLGVVVLVDQQPDKPEDLVAVDFSSHEVQPPEPFTYP